MPAPYVRIEGEYEHHRLIVENTDRAPITVTDFVVQINEFLIEHIKELSANVRILMPNIKGGVTDTMLRDGPQGDWFLPPPTTKPDMYFESAIGSGCGEHFCLPIKVIAEGQVRATPDKF